MVKEIQVYSGDGIDPDEQDWIELCQADLSRHLLSMVDKHGDHYADVAQRVLGVLQDPDRQELKALCFHAAGHPTISMTLRANILLAAEQLFKAVEEL